MNSLHVLTNINATDFASMFDGTVKCAKFAYFDINFFLRNILTKLGVSSADSPFYSSIGRCTDLYLLEIEDCHELL
jgi:hypothetical protein